MIIKLCNRIEYSPIMFIQSIVNNTVTFIDGYAFKVVPDIVNGKFSEEEKTSSHGLVVTQKLDIYANLSISTYKELTETPQIMRLTFSDGTVSVWGNKDMPVRMDTGKREAEASQITYQRKSPSVLL